MMHLHSTFQTHLIQISVPIRSKSNKKNKSRDIDMIAESSVLKQKFIKYLTTEKGWDLKLLQLA